MRDGMCDALSQAFAREVTARNGHMLWEENLEKTA